jgi:hypothetical protein
MQYNKTGEMYTPPSLIKTRQDYELAYRTSETKKPQATARGGETTEEKER